MASREFSVAELFGTADAANFLKIDRSLVLRFIREKRLPAEKFGSQWAIRRRDLEQFAKKRRGRGRQPKP